ncbi:MAG: CocE/NonD family hydrolase, partial [Steroidobacteraceae bacterium]
MTIDIFSASPQRLVDVAPQLERILMGVGDAPSRFAATEIRHETVWVTMRDGVRLATDLYLPPTRTAPAIAMRTPYSRASAKNISISLALARSGYVVIAQDCRGTGDSEPESWDYYVYESEDGVDLVEWIGGQNWFDGFLGACGGSYVGQTQWCMALHPRMSTIVPEVSSLGIAINTAHLYMLINAYARSVGKGKGKVAVHYSELEGQMKEETLAGGYFNEPLHQPFSAALQSLYPELRSMQPAQAKRWLWAQYCALPSAQRAAFIKKALGADSVSMLEVESLSMIFGHRVPHDAHTLPHADPTELCRLLHAPALMITGWYDWALNDELATWDLLRREALQPVRSRCRLIVSPSAHNVPGYREGMNDHPELQRIYRTENILELLLCWYAAVRQGTTDAWPTVIYYLMGANEWRVSSEWPPPEMQHVALYLGPGGTLVSQMPAQNADPDSYTYDPRNPTPTVGGSISPSAALSINVRVGS